MQANAQEVRRAGRCSLVGAGDACRARRQAGCPSKWREHPCKRHRSRLVLRLPPSRRAAASNCHVPRLAGSNVSLPSMSASVITMLPPVALATRLGQRNGAEQCALRCKGAAQPSCPPCCTACIHFGSTLLKLPTPLQPPLVCPPCFPFWPQAHRRSSLGTRRQAMAPASTKYLSAVSSMPLVVRITLAPAAGEVSRAEQGAGGQRFTAWRRRRAA